MVGARSLGPLLVSLAALAWRGAGLQLTAPPPGGAQPTQPNAASSAVVAVHLHNYRDIQFWLDARLGRQRLRLAADTGSSALLVASTCCPASQCARRAFDPAASPTYEAGVPAAEHRESFGSGAALTRWGADLLELLGLPARREAFEEVIGVDAAMRGLWAAAQFDGVLGLPWQGTVPGNHSVQIGKVSSEAPVKLDPTVLESLGVQAFSLCLGRAGAWNATVGGGAVHELVPDGDPRGTSSWLFWHPAGGLRWPGQPPTYIGLAGGRHWTVALSAVSLRHRGVAGGKGARALRLCHEEPCVAVVDSGTSALAAAPKHFRKLLDFLGPEDLCNNMRRLPDLHLRLGSPGRGGVDVVLPPRAYARRLLRRRVSGAEKATPAADLGDLCQLRLRSNTAISGDNAAVWILGVPFLQEYVCEFDRSSRPPRLGVAPHPSDCRPPAARAGGQRLNALSVGATSGQPVADFPEAEAPDDGDAPDLRAILSGSAFGS